MCLKPCPRPHRPHPRHPRSRRGGEGGGDGVGEEFSHGDV